jgi:hypothetical protein
MITYFVLWCYLLIQGMAHITGVLPLAKGGALHRLPCNHRALIRCHAELCRRALPPLRAAAASPDLHHLRYCCHGMLLLRHGEPRRSFSP